MHILHPSYPQNQARQRRARANILRCLYWVPTEIEAIDTDRGYARFYQRDLAEMSEGELLQDRICAEFRLAHEEKTDPWSPAVEWLVERIRRIDRELAARDR